MTRRLFSMAALVVAAAGALTAIRSRTGQAVAQAAPPERSAGPIDPWSDPYSQTIFFAVLEGIYRDGLPNDVVDLVIPPVAVPGGEPQPKMEEHFVYACPLCHPAFEAFRLYRRRQAFYGDKGGRTTFGEGLDGGVVQRLKSQRREERRAAIQSLVESWVRRRLDLMRLTPKERETWDLQIGTRRKQGMMMLQRGGEPYAGWKACAICDGAAGACTAQPPPRAR